MTHNITLPPLPPQQELDAYPSHVDGRTCRILWYKPEDMRVYARAAVELALQGRGEPVAWHSKQYGTVWMAIKPGNLVVGTQWFIQGRQEPVAKVVSPVSLVWHISTSDLDHGTMFYTAPQPAEPVKCPVCFEDEPHTGTCWSSDPKALCNRAEPVKVPSNDIHRDATGETWMGMRVAAWQWKDDTPRGKITRHATHWSTGPQSAERLYRERDIRALLARYGPPAQVAYEFSKQRERIEESMHSGARMTNHRFQLAVDEVQPAASAEPLFWYRPRSDGCYEGPLHNSSIEEVRKRSGAWVPLFAGAAPVATQPAKNDRQQREAAQRDRMAARFKNRPASPATADFDLPAPNDDVGQPVAAQPSVPKYTSDIGLAGQAYLDSFKHAHQLPAQFRWADLWMEMCKAAAPAPTPPADGKDPHV